MLKDEITAFNACYVDFEKMNTEILGVSIDSVHLLPLNVIRMSSDYLKKDGVQTFDDFLRDGLIEYLDVNEENNALFDNSANFIDL
ncbi:RNA polymerase Rpb2, domain 5 [Dillenia turbinata]|uniref:RNA polymerase Rpb2, domain 5 n=1 Tax=Dillenia turbinata TaxID=194707 RepID=A0AAN8UIC8_9MAGN